MRYVLYTPDPENITYEDCEEMDLMMNRLSESDILEIETAPVFYLLHNIPGNCRKYRITLEELDKVERIEQIIGIVRQDCRSRKEREILGKYFILHGDNGTLAEVQGYIKEIRNRIRIFPVIDEELPA